jgi:enamine deaminase RidA (YjgF/YER057c/UK114 family)
VRCRARTDELDTPTSYTRVVVATGSRLVFVAGQMPEDAQGNLVGSGDLAAQARQAFANLGSSLTAGDHKPADTIAGVEALAVPGYLIEVEAIAVLD